MTTAMFLSFLVFAFLLALSPGPDTAVVLKNSLTGGRRLGFGASVGITLGNVVHGTSAVFGVGLLLVQWRPVFEAIRWAGIAYLVYLGVQALRSAWRGGYLDGEAAGDGRARRRGAVARAGVQGFLSNITNPKAFAFYLSVLPQFMAGGDGSVGTLLGLAYTHAAVTLLWLLVLVAGLHLVRDWLRRRVVRRAMDAVTGTALLGFGVKLAADG
ncbi:LysE family translocator [Stackebrandtia nassauensis]|uniref:Lysine exporter protein (LYSE/YGGA) n=1 Tax=Stackebrandtia nassauensis (strain DSM 44728 / CIP 108903 / NRRL B-16338 / NBRC 102104 / LLR-40K-21) TaxID=446470 RepID=D3Q8P3_STANL|nr:LysE family translocator [Stackebrandtia nassauensis]ADD44485.1 Lysine exporter protein (LYSE/YGGA) [Stackebrandtia nassauensis DSM 44728]